METTSQLNQESDPSLFLLVAVSLSVIVAVYFFLFRTNPKEETSRELGTNKKSKKGPQKKELNQASSVNPSLKKEKEKIEERPKLSKKEREREKERLNELSEEKSFIAPVVIDTPNVQAIPAQKKSKKKLKREQDNAQDIEKESAEDKSKDIEKKGKAKENSSDKKALNKKEDILTTEKGAALLQEVHDRLKEGNGETVFEYTILSKTSSDQELDTQTKLLNAIAQAESADLKFLRIIEDKDRGQVAQFLIRRKNPEAEFLEIRVAITGNVDSGKSTLLGVLSKGHLDNGRGSARLHIFRHRHEISTGRTSDIGREVLGFSSTGDITNYSTAAKSPTWPEICEASSKVLMFLDLAGHEKYLKTTLFGLTGNYPDYAMIVVGANMGIVGMTKEHFQLLLALRVPLFIVVTKIDMCPQNKLEETMSDLQRLLKTPAARKIPLIISDEADVFVVAKNFDADRIAPIFLVSNVTGESLDLLKLFLNLLPMRKNWEKLRLDPVELRIDSTFSVSGVGTVVSGTLIQGTIQPNQTLLLGPDEFGKFNPVSVKSIHTNRLPANEAKAGQTAAVALKKVKRTNTRKGMVLLDPALTPPPRSVWEFEAEVFIITHSTTISLNYEAVIHCTCTRQTAKVYWMDQVTIRSGSKALVRFRYRYHPEFIKAGEKLVFREGKTKGIGKVNRLIFDNSDPGSSQSVFAARALQPK